MKPLPNPETYEGELKFMPYKKSLLFVEGSVIVYSPPKADVLDLMCGPGYLLGRIKKRRFDLSLNGMDIDNSYIEHAKKLYPDITFERGDVLTWNTPNKFDVVMCTGALHHIPYEKQEAVVKKMSQLLKSKGLAIISDCHIDYYKNELERKLAATKLGYEYLRETIANGAPNDVIESTADIITNDVLMDEFKTSVANRNEIIERYFDYVNIEKIWPDTLFGGYGDYVFLLGSPKDRK